MRAMPHFRSITYTAPEAGTSFLVLGAVHGNEVCGTRAIEQVMQELDAGTLRLRAGSVTFVPITNPKAYAQATRNGDRNLNRKLCSATLPADFEDRVANWLCPLMARHEVLLDLHSFHAGHGPFVMVGPQNNDGTLEPFRHAAQEKALALRLGVRRGVDGWMRAYAEGVQRRRDLARQYPEAAVDADEAYGVGTTEYMRSVGGWGLTLECGQHDDPGARAVAYRAICTALAHLGVLDAPRPVPVSNFEGLRLRQVVQRLHAADAFTRAWKSFDPVTQGEVVALRASGEEVRAPADGYVVFPNSAAEPGREWLYWAGADARLHVG